MTTQEIVDYYAKLLIIQYANKPKAYATIQALVGPTLIDQLPIAVQNAFNLETATGAQLDVIGKYVGVTRSGYTFLGYVTLSDADFLTLIKFAIVINNNKSALADIQGLLINFFGDLILIFDRANMQIGYFLNEQIGSKFLVEMMLIQGLLPRPMGVQLAATIYAPNIKNFFGMRSYDVAPQNVSGLNSYSSYDQTRTWLSYSYALVIP